MSVDAQENTTVRTPRTRLFTMMMLQIFIWGAWLPLIFGYLPTLGFSPLEQSWILNAFPVAAIIGLFFSNQFADRNFAAEKFLSFSHLIGGLSMFGLTMTTDFWPFLILMWVHCLFYVPTISITNSIAFAHMKDPASEFGPIRMGGTLGWILAAWPFAFILVDWAAVRAAEPDGLIELIGIALGSGLTGDELRAATPWTFRVAGIASLALAAYSLFLPHTPASKARGESVDKLAWLEAAKLLKHPFILVLWIVTLADSFVHNAFFNWAAVFFGSDGQLVGVEAGQPAVGAEARGARIAGARPALVAVAVAHHARAVAEREAVHQEPFEAAPGRVDLHRRLEPGVVGEADVGIAPADMGIDDAVLVGQVLEKLARVR